MEALEAILTRRSIRQYTSERVSDELLQQLLKAAVSAPTATGEAWHFIVVRDRGTLAAIPKFHPHAHMLESCSAGVVVCGDTQAEKMPGRWPLDCAAATATMLIAANCLGVGACWVGIYPVEERIQGMRKLLNLPDHITPLSVVSLGYPAEKKSAPKRRLEDYLHHEKW